MIVHNSTATLSRSPCSRAINPMQPVPRALARSAAGDSQNVLGDQLEQSGAAGQAAHGARWVGVVLCTRAAVTDWD